METRWMLPVVLMLVFLVALVSHGCTALVEQAGTFRDGNSVAFDFSVNGTGQLLDGEVFLDGYPLGNTSNGSLVVRKSRLAGSRLALSGTDAASGGNYTFYFDLDDNDLALDRIMFYVPEQEFIDELFDASLLDFEKIAKRVFAMTNDERALAGLRPLRLNALVGKVAAGYAKELPAEGFHHTDTRGRDVKQRLSDAGMVFVAANENLYFSGSLSADADLARTAIDGWLSSPGHRATLLDRDDIYSDAGVGVHCVRKECYVVMDFAALMQQQKADLPRGWATFHYLNNPGYGFPAGRVKVRFALSSTGPVNVYVVPDYDSYRQFGEGNEPKSLREFPGITSLEQEFDAASGEGVIIEAGSGNAHVEFSLDFS